MRCVIKKPVIKTIGVGKLYAWRPKVTETVIDVREGRLSRSNKNPLVVSQLDSPRGAFWIVDGHHRAVEAIQAGKKSVKVMIDSNVPCIERTGGAYRSVLSDKIQMTSPSSCLWSWWSDIVRAY